MLLTHTAKLVGVLCLALVATAPAQGGRAKAGSCGASSFSYAGLRSDRKAHGVAATLVAMSAPTVSSGHVAGWVGVSGGGPGGTGGWIQVGLAALGGEDAGELYYEVAVPGARPYSVQISTDVQPGDEHRVAVLAMSGRKAWWRVWVDNQPVTPPIHLPGSHNGWYAQAVGESADDGIGICNGYAYNFTDVTVARASGGNWRPLEGSSVFADRGYRAVQTSSTPRSFIATSA